MKRSLVVVESPAKAKTIAKFLGRGYTVKASMGHLRDLPKSKIGVDIKNGYEPKYINIRGKGSIIKELKTAAGKNDRVLLATDPDREGEAIAWHLAHLLDLPEGEECRIEFNEITKDAITNAVKSPRKLDINRVNAQQARRVLDRLVGYSLSPLLWKKVKKGLSAGRVQSVALRLICDREREIEGFIPEEYWSIKGLFVPEGNDVILEAELKKYNGKKPSIKAKAEADRIAEEIRRERYIISDISEKDRKKYPAPPFTTSTLQQEASRRLGFPARKTMNIAQELYEGLEIKGEGSVGLISYIRTDSLRVSKEAQAEARKLIEERYGKGYLPARAPQYKSKGSIQDAHEAIRPTSTERDPESVKGSLTRDQYKLYKLIWERFVASQMAPAVIETKSIDIEGGPFLFKVTGSRVKFDGFLSVYEESVDDAKEDEEGGSIPEIKGLSKGMKMGLKDVKPKQHFTQPPPRYSEASLVKTLEEKGIGRPSTYAPTIDTIIKRNYVVIEDKRLVPTELGFIVVDLLKEHFPDIIDVDFTANMEEQLDKIAEGVFDWRNVVDSFYKPFERSLEKAQERISQVEIPDEVTEELCPECGRNLVIKQGRFGKFLACPGFPECKFTKPLVKPLGVECPKCGREIVERRSKKGRKFYGCSGYPECDFTVWNEPVNKRCPECGNILVITKRLNNHYLVKCSGKECAYNEKMEQLPG